MAKNFIGRAGDTEAHIREALHLSPRDTFRPRYSGGQQDENASTRHAKGGNSRGLNAWLQRLARMALTATTPNATSRYPPFRDVRGHPRQKFSDRQVTTQSGPSALPNK
jgi:hypothetical protein